MMNRLILRRWGGRILRRELFGKGIGATESRLFLGACLRLSQGFPLHEQAFLMSAGGACLRLSGLHDAAASAYEQAAAMHAGATAGEPLEQLNAMLRAGWLLGEAGLSHIHCNNHMATLECSRQAASFAALAAEAAARVGQVNHPERIDEALVALEARQHTLVALSHFVCRDWDAAIVKVVEVSRKDRAALAWVCTRDPVPKGFPHFLDDVLELKAPDTENKPIDVIVPAG